VTFGLAAWARGIFGLPPFEARVGKPAAGHVHEVGHSAAKLLCQEEQDSQRRVAQPALDLRVVPESDALDILLSQPSEPSSMANVRAYKLLKPPFFHGSRLSDH
jgi:hypothetical protein